MLLKIAPVIKLLALFLLVSSYEVRLTVLFSSLLIDFLLFNAKPSLLAKLRKAPPIAITVPPACTKLFIFFKPLLFKIVL